MDRETAADKEGLAPHREETRGMEVGSFGEMALKQQVQAGKAL
jgi:hypothetical protein